MEQPPRSPHVLEFIMVLSVLAAACYMAIRNNNPEIIFNLCTLCFGYYFRGLTGSGGTWRK